MVVVGGISSISSSFSRSSGSGILMVVVVVVVVILVGEVINLYNKEKKAYSNVEAVRYTKI